MRTILRALFIGVIILIFLSLSLVFILHFQNQTIKKEHEKITEIKGAYIGLKKEYDTYLEKNKNSEVFSDESATAPTSAQIQDIIQSSIRDANGEVSVYYKNLTSGDTVTINGEQNYYMASLYKIILTIYILDEVQKGKVNLESKVGSGSATIEFALGKIITESNNEYAVSLAENYGWEKIETAMRLKYATSFNFDAGLETNVEHIGMLFEDIAFSLRGSDDNSKYLLTLLNDQKRLSKLPKYLPKHIYSHNKTGELDQFSHDAGLFYTPKANYILVFMSKTKTPGDTNEKMAKMSLKIYEELNSLSPLSN